MKDPADQWDSPLDRERPAEPSAFFKSLAAADAAIAATPEWKPLAAGMAKLIDRYMADAADVTQRNAIMNVVNLLRHASAFSAALCVEVEDLHQQLEAARAVTV